MAGLQLRAGESQCRQRLADFTAGRKMGERGGGACSVAGVCEGQSRESVGACCLGGRQFSSLRRISSTGAGIVAPREQLCADSEFVRRGYGGLFLHVALRGARACNERGHTNQHKAQRIQSRNERGTDHQGSIFARRGRVN